MDFCDGWSGMDSSRYGNGMVVLRRNEVSGQSGWCFFSLNSRIRGNDGVFFSDVGVVGR